MNNLRKNVELAANIAIVVVAILLCVVLVKSYLSPTLAQHSAVAPVNTGKMLERGDQIPLSDIDWQKNGKTLLLALSVTCHFCTQSAPFYQRVIEEHSNTHLIALVPQATDEGQAYLNKLGVNINDVRQVSIDSLGLSGTPTLILVDRSGSVADIWVGALSPNKEEEVIGRLHT